MKKSIVALMGMALIGTLLLTSGVMAGRGGAGMGGRGMGMGMGPERSWSSRFPDLTAEQSAKLTDLQKRFN